MQQYTAFLDITDKKVVNDDMMLHILNYLSARMNDGSELTTIEPLLNNACRMKTRLDGMASVCVRVELRSN